jgi:hypothetical protein
MFYDPQFDGTAGHVGLFSQCDDVLARRTGSGVVSSTQIRAGALSCLSTPASVEVEAAGMTEGQSKCFLVLDLLSFRCKFYTASFVRTISIDQPRKIIRFERIHLSRLLTCWVQGQVHAAVVG